MKNGSELLLSSLTALRVGGVAAGVSSAAGGLAAAAADDGGAVVGAATAARVSRTVATSPAVPRTVVRAVR
ncbi:hypothetical protein [Paractinoplanes durhamensis]|uniref:hypothetical protein n=1 Tax=Paractinoplanes durhamensis TaxID=113563 RepID=UPI00363C9FC8